MVKKVTNLSRFYGENPAAVHILAKIRPLPSHRQTPQFLVKEFIRDVFNTKNFVKHASAFATALPGFLNAKICKAEDI